MQTPTSVMPASTRVLAVLLLLAAPAAATRASTTWKEIYARHLAASGLPDPKCKTGVISIPSGQKDAVQVCCAGYCGECSDYPTCKSVRGQASENACCATSVA